MSTVTGSVVHQVRLQDPTLAGHTIASALSIIVGAIVAFIGLTRLGWLVDFIPLVAISAYMTGSAIFIIVGQLPTLMGINQVATFNTRAQSYKVIINTLRCLPVTQIDAALGLTALTMLYIIRFTFNYLAKKQPNHRRVWFFCNTLRTVFVILLYTMISWLGNLHLKDHNSDNSAWAILGTVPRGFQDARVPKIDSHIISLFSSQLPASVIVVLIEHISIAKSFGRINNYTINPSQELVAIGVTNLLAPFLGGYPSTGSFSRTAIKSKAGVRTPFAGVITALVVLLAIYALPAVFFYIPSAALSAVIIHAVGDLITPPNTVYQFWKVSPIEVFIFFAGVLVTVFSSIEDGIYTTVTTSLALFLYRVFKAKGRFLGRVKVHSVIGDHLLDGDDTRVSNPRKPDNDPDSSARNIFLPMDNEDGTNPLIKPQQPYPGIFIFRFSEGYNYPNANHYLDFMVSEIFRQTQRTDKTTYPRPGDRPWNDPGPRPGKERAAEDIRPTLKAIILDFSSVNNVDLTSTQNLIDVRNQMDRYAAPDKVQWHFACINNRWTKRSLASAGFGFSTSEGNVEYHRWKPIFSVAELGGSYSAAADAEDAVNRKLSRMETRDEENGNARPISKQGVETQREVDSINEAESEESSNLDKELRYSKAYKRDDANVKVAVVHGLNRPFFHIDLTSALQSAIHNTEALKVKGEEPEMMEQSKNPGPAPDGHT